ncbi:substrate-binding domain-containing protein [Bifidobacterium asteroides]
MRSPNFHQQRRSPCGNCQSHSGEKHRSRVPDDIKADSTEGARTDSYPKVPLSVVAATGVDMGRKAATLLMDEFSNSRHVHGSVLIESTLVERDSSRSAYSH